MNDGRYHFQVGKFFRSDIIEQSHSFAVWHGKALGEIAEGSSDLAIGTAEMLKPIIT
jgi:hypothetical protein